MTKQYPNYAAKKQAQQSGSYIGNSPFFTNIQEFQWLKPLDNYPHLKRHLTPRKPKHFEEEYEIPVRYKKK